MTFAPVGSLIQATTSTFSLTPGGVGDLILIEVIAIDGTFLASTLTSTNVTWAPMATFTGTNNSWGATLFMGTVTAASTATVTLAWDGSASTTFRIAGQEFSSTVGSWALDVQGTIDSLFGTSFWAQLSPTQAGELYFGYAINSATASAGSTPGFTYEIDAHGNGVAYNAACTSAAQQPAWADSSQSLGIMVLFREVAFSVTTLNSSANWNALFTTPDGNYEISVDAFENTLAPFTSQVTWANTESDWGTTVSITAAGNQVYTYPDAARAFAQLPLPSLGHVIAKYSYTMPTTANGLTGELMFDCWLNGSGPGFGDEVSIFVENQGVSPAGDTVLGTGLSFHGSNASWTAYERPASSPPQFIFVPTPNLPRTGTIDLLPMFNWLVTNGYLASPSTMQEVELGWEIITTGGVPLTFRMLSYSASVTPASLAQGSRHVIAPASGNLALGDGHPGGGG